MTEAPENETGDDGQPVPDNSEPEAPASDASVEAPSGESDQHEIKFETESIELSDEVQERVVELPNENPPPPDESSDPGSSEPAEPSPPEPSPPEPSSPEPGADEAFGTEEVEKGEE